MGPIGQTGRCWTTGRACMATCSFHSSRPWCPLGPTAHSKFRRSDKGCLVVQSREHSQPGRPTTPPRPATATTTSALPDPRCLNAISHHSRLVSEPTPQHRPTVCVQTSW
jgi:hypothetical protein